MNGDKYCYILDYSDGLIYSIELTEDDKTLESEDLLYKYGFNDSNCSWMFSDTKIDNIIEVNE